MPSDPSKVLPRKGAASDPLRFAHPFFTEIPPADRPATAHGTRMLDFIAAKLSVVPKTRGSGLFTLADVIGKKGSAAIEQGGKILLHVCGDTGVTEFDRETRQVMVADAMTRDYDAAKPASSPACLLHLGDVIYGPNPKGFLDQFYRPYMHYPGKIIAIPGNHDAESPEKMSAFQGNFCAKTQAVPAIAGSIFRQTMNQPGVYWCLDAPFVQIIGLFSNSAENPGAISGGAAGTGQTVWLVKTLKKLKAQRAARPRKALLFATHHPPYSAGGHSGSAGMLADIDNACAQAGIWPDAFFSGHAHSIQRYTRTVLQGGLTKQVPYVVTGCGGHGGQWVVPPGGTTATNPVYNFGYQGWGFTTVEVDAQTLTIRSQGVDWTSVKTVDQCTVNL